MPTLSDEQMQQYLSLGGVRCPHCGSQDLEGQSVEINQGEAVQEVGCDSCGACWYDIYVLARIEAAP